MLCSLVLSQRWLVKWAWVILSDNKFKFQLNMQVTDQNISTCGGNPVGHLKSSKTLSYLFKENSVWLEWDLLIPWPWLCCIALFIYKITKIVRMLWLAERHVCMTVWLWRQDFASGLHNCLKFSQTPLCLYQAMQTWKMFPITLSHNPFFL